MSSRETRALDGGALYRADFTIRDLTDSVRDSETYVCGVLGNMNAWERRQGEQGYVTIGVTGKGVAPHFMTGHLFDHARYSYSVHGFDGSTRAVLPYKVSDLEAAWITSFMSHAEVKALLGEFRALKRVPRRST